MSNVPRIADVHCVPMRFQPGDRILVKARGVLDSVAMNRLRKTVQKWAGDHVEVLVIDDRVAIEHIPQSSIGE